MDSDLGSVIEVAQNNQPLGVSGESNVAVVVNALDYASLVPEEERAESEVLPQEYKEACEMGVFSSAAGMARIDNALDGKLFAAISVDAKGNRTIEFCQQYDSGDFSPKVTVSQGDLLFASANGFVPNGVPVPRMKARLGKFLEQVTIDYFSRIARGTVYPPVDILRALVTVIDQLPVFRANSGEWTPVTLYAAIMDMINGKTTAPITPFGKHKAFMAFAEFQINAMADHLKMKSGEELLKLLAEYRFLYLTESSEGYQSRVYVEGNQRDWAYCIYKAEYIAARMREER